jgi:hypothetical protein
MRHGAVYGASLTNDMTIIDVASLKAEKLLVPSELALFTSLRP